MEESRRKVDYESFTERLTVNMWHAQRHVERVTCYLQEPRHVEDIAGSMEDEWDAIDECRRKGGDRLRTASIAIVMCLHLGVDPPDAPSRKDAPARLISWVDPYKCGAHKAATEIGQNTQRAYEKWQPKSNTRTRYKICVDPPIDDVRKTTTNLRRISGTDRVLFHYNGHGVPRPTDNGEIWVFNKSFTQYIPLSIFDLQGWLDYPTIYIWETHSAETILNNYRRFGEDQRISWQSRFDRWQEEQSTALAPVTSKMDDWEMAEKMGFSEKYPRYNECIHLAACSIGQFLPMSNPHLPADLFTSCLTTPIRTSLAFHLSNSEHRDEYPENILEMIPGNLSERRTVLGELNWIFTAITDTIAFTSIDREIFQKLFRQDLLLATLFRSFLLAQRVMSKFDVLPVSHPSLKDTSKHELWRCWDQTMDMVLDYCRELMYVRETEKALFIGRDVIMRSNVFPYLVLIDFEHAISYSESLQYNTFFTEQLQAFELWLDYGVDEGQPPLQLPMVLQVLLSQAHRVRALRLLARFLDFGRWAIGYSLAVGIFPYVLKLLQSNISDLKISLAFIWAKILAVDPSCQMELFNECIDESSQAQTTPQQQTSAILKPSAMFANHPPAPQLAMDKRALHIAQAGGRFQNNPNQAMDMQLQYAQQQQQQQQQQPQLQRHDSSGQQSPNPQRQQAQQQPPQQQNQQQQQQQQQQGQPGQQQKGIMKQTSSAAQPEKKTMLRFQYFLSLLADPDVKPQQKTVAAFVLAQLTSNNYKIAQKELTTKGYLAHCIDLLCDDDARSVKLLKLWLLIGLGRLWSDYDVARWTGIRLMAHDKVISELSDDSAEVRAAAVFALGSLLKNSSGSNEHASAVEENIADELCTNCVFDSSVLVREELIVSLQWFVFDFEKRFVKTLYELARLLKFTIPKRGEFDKEEPNEEGYDVAAEMPTAGGPRTPPIKEFTQPTINRKKMSTSMFVTAVEETVYEDSTTGHVYTQSQEAKAVRCSEDEMYSREYRQRAMRQIKHLEGKTFNEGVSRTWLAVLRLSLDPVERVARMAQKIVYQVEEGVPEMQSAINNTVDTLNERMAARKTSQVTVEMPRRPVGHSNEAAALAEQIHKNLRIEKEYGNCSGIDFTEMKSKIRNQGNMKTKGKVRTLQEEAKVKFQVGSVDENAAHSHHKNVLSADSSVTDDTQSSELFSKDEDSEGGYDEEDRAIVQNIPPPIILKEDDLKNAENNRDAFFAIALKEFTPKRANKIGVGPGFTKDGESKSLRNIIDNPLVTTQFVSWCSKVFVEPILHVIALDDVKSDGSDHDDEDEFMPDMFRDQIKKLHAADKRKNEQKRKQDEKDGRKHKTQEEIVLTTTTISDWALHAMEGMVQSAEIEGRDFKSTRYDHCLWQVKLDHPASSLVTSKLRRCMYASDGRKMTIIRQDVDPRNFRKFDLNDGNPFVADVASQLILINEVSREMIIACSPNGIVRIWDPYFLGWCDDYEKPPELVSACTALESQMELSDTTNRCLFDWNQPNGKLLCTGTRSVRIWDAHAEKVCQDIPYSPASMQSTGPMARKGLKLLPTAMASNLDDEGNIVCVGYESGSVDYFDMRMRGKAARVVLTPPMGTKMENSTPSVMYMKVNRRGLDNEMFAGTLDGNIYKLQLRMYKETSPAITVPWEPKKHHKMYVHDDSRILASTSAAELRIYDVSQNKQMAAIAPPVQRGVPDSIRKEKSNTSFGLFGATQRKTSTASTATISSRVSDKENQSKPKKGEDEFRIISLTMHQMRLLTVAGYSDNTVCVYGSKNPGLTGHYQTKMAPRPPSQQY